MSALHEIAIREALTFLGALIGILWGYMVGVRIERQRWLRSLLPALEAVVAGARQTETHIHRLLESA